MWPVVYGVALPEEAWRQEEKNNIWLGSRVTVLAVEQSLAQISRRVFVRLVFNFRNRKKSEREGCVLLRV